MLDETRTNLLKLLVALAWADGRVDEGEMEIVEAMLDSFDASTEDGNDIREWAKKPRSLDDVDVAELTEEDADLVLYQAVLLTFIDDEQSEKETELLNNFVAKLGMSAERAEDVLERATARAKELLPVLDS
ncbi:MAG: tellurite resistance TerB family protein [Proteobacteria bacterium]|nr:tellurite resistance TerB family protein [Pseudomonadota bacterium]